MLALFTQNQMEKKKVRLAANKSRHQVMIMWEKQTPHLKGFLVKGGRRHILVITVSHMKEITTSVGIPTEPPTPKCGAIPLIQKFSHTIALSPFAPH